MLDVLFSSILDSQEKKAILSTEFNLPMTEEFDQGVNDMCNFFLFLHINKIFLCRIRFLITKDAL